MQVQRIESFAKNMIYSSKKFASQTEINGMTSEVKYYGNGIFETIKRNAQGEVSRVESSLFDQQTNAKICDIFRYQDGSSTKWDYDPKTGAIINHTTIRANGQKSINKL